MNQKEDMTFKINHDLSVEANFQMTKFKEEEFLENLKEEDTMETNLERVKTFYKEKVPGIVAELKGTGKT